MPGRCGIRSEPCRDVAATAQAPQTLPDRRLQVLSEREACRLVSHRNTIRFGRYTWEPPKGLPGARNPKRNIAENVQHQREFAAHRTCCHARCRTACETTLRRRPNATKLRFLRIETRAHRSLVVLGGPDENVETKRRVNNLRLDTTTHPHDVETGDVTTTASARASHEVSGMR